MKKFWALSVLVLFFSACKDNSLSDTEYNKTKVCRLFAVADKTYSVQMLKYLDCDKKDLIDFLSVYFSEEIESAEGQYIIIKSEREKKYKEISAYWDKVLAADNTKSSDKK